MRFLFRVDAGGAIGLGHFIRSESLANSLANRGHEIHFVSQYSFFWRKKISSGFAYSHNFLTNTTHEVSLIKEHEIDLFYVDGIIDYSIENINIIKAICPVVFYQNIGTSRHLADVFILPSLHQNKNFFKDFYIETRIYQGLEYFLFNEKCKSLKPKIFNEVVKRIGVTSGGSDPRNTLFCIYKYLDFDEFKNIEFLFFYGDNFQHMTSIPAETRHNVRILKYEISEIYKCDILISAFGVSTYEFLALGMPIITYGHQESNTDAANFLANQTSACLSIGLIDNVQRSQLNSHLKSLIIDRKKRNNLMNSAKDVLDFKGLGRVVEILESTQNDKK